MFISFEGIDGCGKSTQIKLLSEYLISLGNKVLTIREPGGNSLSEAIRKILLSSKNEIDPITELLLFESARANLIRQTIKPSLDDGFIILSDRFYDSTIAYQGYGRGINLDYITQINTIATNGLKPDLTFLLDVDIQTSKNRSNFRVSDRIELSDDSFFEKVIDGFRIIAANEPDRLIVIDAKNNIQSTHNKILSVLINKFPNIFRLP
jgi:dTMP kinase